MNRFILRFWLIAGLGLSILQSCVNSETLYQETSNKPIGEYADFSTRKIVWLSLDYGFKGYKGVLFEVYGENPFDDHQVKKIDIEPIYKAFLNGNCTFEGEMEIPSTVKTLYICTDAIGLKPCISLIIENGKASYTDSDELSESILTKTRAASYIIPRSFSNFNYLRGLYDYYDPSSWWCSSTTMPSLYTSLSKDQKLTTESAIGDLMNRLNNGLSKIDNQTYVHDDAANITTMAAGNLEFCFLSCRQPYSKALAYYYYPSYKKLTSDEIKMLPKFFILPRMNEVKPSKLVKVNLQFFGDNYSALGSKTFPAGYTIGWLTVTDMYNIGTETATTASDNLSKVEAQIATSYAKNKVVYSNKIANYNAQNGYISFYDSKSQCVICGVEDQSYKPLYEVNPNYTDVLFYVKASAGVINNQLRRSIPSNTTNQIVATETTRGTWLFEDVWPTGGDYDMNDVIIEYSSTLYFDINNKITKVVDRFIPVHDGATYLNAFGYSIMEHPGILIPNESSYDQREDPNQYLVCENVKEAVRVNKEYVVARSFSPTKEKERYKRTYNPFIVVKYQKNAKNRTEVHLPKMNPTSWANFKLNGTKNDAFYINKNGEYPFALDLPIVGFVPVKESQTIGSGNAYSGFTDWAKSGGAKNTNWYLSKK